MKVTIHQPDLLPCSGFWFKMADCDVFVLSVHDQFQKHGYQRRVTMRERWCSHQLTGNHRWSRSTRLRSCRAGKAHHGRHPWALSGAKHFDTRGTELVERILGSRGRTPRRSQHTAMIEIVRDMLGITTPLVVTAPPAGCGHRAPYRTGLGRWRHDSYLAGPGRSRLHGRRRRRLVLRRRTAARSGRTTARHRGIRSCTVLMDYDDPMDIVREGPERGRPGVGIVVPVFNTDPDHFASRRPLRANQTVPVQVVWSMTALPSARPCTRSRTSPPRRPPAHPTRGELRTGNSHEHRSRGPRRPYVFAMGSDDIVEPTYAARAGEVLDDRPDVSIVTTKIQCFGESTELDSSVGAPNGLVDMLFYSVIPGISVFRRGTGSRRRLR